jgi:hypothetical protein
VEGTPEACIVSFREGRVVDEGRIQKGSAGSVVIGVAGLG